MDDIIYTSATRLVQAIADKEVSSAEVIDAHLERIEVVNPKLNAVVQLAEERARSEAQEADAALAKGESKGALHGLPITIKDSLDTEGIVTTGGTMGRKGSVPDSDSTVVARLRAAGAIVLGKTNTPELTMAYETDNLVYGVTRNPYDLTRTPGGSSGGAGAIIASGGSPLDMGSDTGGSIRQPSHFSGIAGIKPTSGRVPRTGHAVPYALGAQDSLTQIGPMARYVDDLVLALPIISGVDWRDPAIVPMPLGDPNDVDLGALRIAMHTDNGICTPDEDVMQVVRDAVAALNGVVSVIDERRPEALAKYSEMTDLDKDGNAWLTRLLARSGTTEIHPWISHWIESTETWTADRYSAALEERDEFCSEMLTFMEDYDAILCPPAAKPAIPLGTWIDDENEHLFTYTAVYNVTGWPGTVVRGGTSAEGLPIGVQVVTRPWREDVSLALAARLEAELGGFQPPSI